MSHRKALIRFVCITSVLLTCVLVPRQARAWSTGQSADLVLGQADMHSAISATAFGMTHPMAIAYDAVNDKFYVADAENNRVLRFSSAVALVDGSSAEAVLGQTDFTSSGHSVTATTMNSPEGLALDASGRLWVADTNNNRVLRFDLAYSRANGAAADAVLGQINFTSSSTATSQSGLHGPTGLAVDSSGYLWVSDLQNHRVLRFNNAAGKANGGNADSVLGQSTFSASSSALTQTGMGYPRGLTVDGSNHLWVADFLYNRVLRFNNANTRSNGAAADGVLGQSSYTSSAMAVSSTGMEQPNGVSIDSSGRLWVADGSASRVLRFDSAASKSNGAAANAVLGEPDFTTTALSTTQNGMNRPAGVFADSSVSGHLWVAEVDNNRVVRFDNAAGKANGANADGVLGHADFTSNGSAYATPTLMHFPHAAAIDPTSGKLFVVDTQNSRVLRFTSAGALQAGAAAEAVFGQPNFYSNLPQQTTTAGVFYGPTGIAIDQNEHLWISDTSQSRVLRFDNADTKASGAPADAVLGQSDFSSSAPATTAAGMDHPAGLAVDGAGRLWVADTLNNRVLRFDDAASLSNGSPANAVIGQTDFTSSSYSMTANSNGLSHPLGVAVNGSGVLWVSDQGNNRVLRFDGAAVKPNGAAADSVLGQPSFTTNGSATNATGLNGPGQIAVNGLGQLWVTDTYNHRVLWFNQAASAASGAAADGVLGQADFSSKVASTTSSGFDQPSGIAVSLTNAVWVVDTNNHRVLRFPNDHIVNMPMVVRH
jgi:sugar lactone lactonase YvrE